ncbi:centromere protein C isoform X2 [Hemicordylus capensis]|uniref:centromere protein C isoform X2 n=1 Tax=Hemicordylus capensis TaxID=884348 RepID=UPI00230377E1|nr:centromere protein C isoform X2 [Hemicordylus capensis]
MRAALGGPAAASTHSHLKSYRARYRLRESQRQAIDIQQGQNVLKFIQDCFETCAKECTVNSPSSSSCSSPDLNQIQVPSNRKEKEQRGPDKINYVMSAFNTFTFLPSPDRKDRSSDEDADVSLGSPALLVEEEQKSSVCKLNFEEDAVVTEMQKSRDIRESPEYRASKEIKEFSVEESKCFAVSSTQKNKSKSLEPLENMPRSSMQRNTVDMEPENEWEFLIEESFGIPSTSWISVPQKNKKPEKRRLTATLSEEKKAAKQQSIKRKDKRASKKPTVAPTPIKQTKMKLTDVTERTVDEFQKVSRTSGRTLVNDQPQLFARTTQQARKQTHSKGEPSVEIHNKDSQESSRENLHLEDQAAYLEEDHSLPVQPPTVVRSEVKPLVKMHNELHQETRSIDMHLEDKVSVLEGDHNVSKVLLPVPSTIQQLSCSKKAMKQTCSKMEDETSAKTPSGDYQEYLPTDMSSKVCQESKDTTAHSEDQDSVIEHNRLSVLPLIPLFQQLSNCKPVKKHKSSKEAKASKTKLSKQSKPQKNNIKIYNVGTKRRKIRVLTSEESSESEHGEEQCDKWANNPHEQSRQTDLRETPHISPKVRQTFLVSPDDDHGNASHQEDSCERFSCSPDAKLNDLSGPVLKQNYKSSSKCKKSLNTESTTSDESMDSEEDLDVLVTDSLKHKLVMPTNTPNVRRTKRMRLKPLEYWRGERVNYKTRPSGGFVVNGIISPEQKQPRKSKKTIKPVLQSENLLDDVMVSIKDPSQPATVFDAASNQEVLLECVSSGSSHLLFVNNETVSVYKYLTTPFFSAGKMILKPLKEKGYQYSHSDTLVFHIICGKLLLMLYEQCYCLTAGDYFYIPAGNVYNIRNLLNKECVVLFTQLKGKRQENE